MHKLAKVYPINDLENSGLRTKCVTLGRKDLERSSITGMSQLTTKLWLHPIAGGYRSAGQSALARRLLQGICIEDGINISKIDFALPGLELIEQFSNQLQIGLSIAHCSDMLVVALSHQAIGVDCEAFGRLRNWDGIADNFFSESEAKAIAASEPCEKEALFLRHWVLKEAYIKAIRGSIFGDLNRLILENKDRGRIAGGNNDGWNAWLVGEGNCIVALCGPRAELSAAYRVGKLPQSQGEGISSISRIDSVHQIKVV